VGDTAPASYTNYTAPLGMFCSPATRQVSYCLFTAEHTTRPINTTSVQTEAGKHGIKAARDKIKILGNMQWLDITSDNSIMLEQSILTWGDISRLNDLMAI
jgi:hypothetical protein